MKKYRIYINPREYIEVEAECPSREIAKAGVGYFWKIELNKGHV